MRASQGRRGFTLVELAVVITILGILVAFAVPRFVRLAVEARMAATKALGDSVRSTAALAHALWLAGGQPSTVSMDGQHIALTADGYPTTAAIQLALRPQPDFTFADGVWTREDASDDARCRVTYTTPPGSAPGVEVLTDSC